MRGSSRSTCPACSSSRSGSCATTTSRPRASESWCRPTSPGAWTTDLDRAGFDRAPRTTWLAEGLLPYLTEATREAVIDALTERSVPGSHFGLTLARADRRAVTPRDPDALPSRPGDYVALWQSDAPPDAHVWLGERGWSVEQYDAVERGAAYGLEVPAAPQARAGDRARLVGRDAILIRLRGQMSGPGSPDALRTSPSRRSSAVSRRPVSRATSRASAVRVRARRDRGCAGALRRSRGRRG